MIAANVTVIICVRNGQDFLAEALDSVAAQSLVPAEVIVINDGSIDNSSPIASAHALAPRVINQRPRGLAASINNGVAQSSSTYLTFLDCDDVWPIHRTSQMLSALGNAAQYDAVAGLAVNTDSNLNPTMPPIPARVLTGMMIRRHVFDLVGPLDEQKTHTANVDWVMKALRMGVNVADIEHTVLYRRIHGGNMGITDKEQARKDLLNTIRTHLHSQDGK